MLNTFGIFHQCSFQSPFNNTFSMIHNEHTYTVCVLNVIEDFLRKTHYYHFGQFQIFAIEATEYEKVIKMCDHIVDHKSKTIKYTLMCNTSK